VLAAAMVVWTAAMILLTWAARRRETAGYNWTPLLAGWTIGAFGLGAFYLLRLIVSSARAQQAPYCDSYAHLWLTFSWLLLPLPLICIGGIGYMYYELFRGVVPRGGDR
jgi:hypothetical protein